jgi:hypothetical protein
MHFIFSYILIISGNTVIEYEVGCALIQATFARLVVLSSIFGHVTRLKCSMCGILVSFHYHLFWAVNSSYVELDKVMPAASPSPT